MATVLKQQAVNSIAHEDLEDLSVSTVIAVVLAHIWFPAAAVAFVMGVWAGFVPPSDPSSIDTFPVWFLTSLMLFFVGDVVNVLVGKKSLVLDVLPTLWKKT